MKEERFLRTLKSIIKKPLSGRIGVGDDCALIDVSSGEILITVDSFVEEVHFPAWIEPEDLFLRAISAALSDINAMGGRGRSILVSLALPGNLASKLKLYGEAMVRVSERYNLEIVGGDTVSAPLRVVSIIVTGELPSGKRPLLRSGARPGDFIYLSGEIGRSAAGLSLVKLGWKKKKGRWSRKGSRPLPIQLEALDHYLTPSIPYLLGWNLLGEGEANSAIDISDGLALDLQRLLYSSSSGADIQIRDIPIHLSASLLSTEEILSGGEEFSLLWTSDKVLPFPTIGKVRRGRGLRFFSGKETIKIHSAGFDHFGRKRQVLSED